MSTRRTEPITLEALGVENDGLPHVAGEFCERTLAEHIRACRVLLAEEQRKPNPDTALVATLCDSVRLARELALVWDRA